MAWCWVKVSVRKMSFYLLFVILLCTACSTDKQYEHFIAAPLEVQAKRACSDTIESCDFYHCRDSCTPCSSTGYYLGYGNYYCRLFSNAYEQMSPAGQAWIDCTRTCLIRYIDTMIQETSDCAVVEELAFDSHPSCYVDCGFCALPATDIRRVRNLVGDNSNFNQDITIVWECLSFPAPPANQGFQNSCVADNGGCRNGVAVELEPAELARLNRECSNKTGYQGPESTLTTDDCVKYFR